MLYPDHYDAGFGDLYIVPPGGGTPIQIGELRDLSFNFDSDQKPLYGRQRLPVKMLQGQGKPVGKAKFTRLYTDLVSQIVPNSTVATGMYVPVQETVNGITTTYSVTGAGASQVDFIRGLSVYDVTDPTLRSRLAEVASGPTAGQYAVDETSPGQGVYSFAAGDAGRNVQINYLKKTTFGRTTSMKNGPLAVAVQFKLYAFNQFDNQINGYVFYAAWLKGINFAQKIDDWNESDIDITLGADSAGNFCDWHEGPLS